MKFVFLTLLTLAGVWAITVEEIVEAMEKNSRATNSEQKITMQVQTHRGLRTMKMQSWAQGTEKSFIKVLYPKKDKGITFLKLDNQMWQYIPKIEKVIKIPASMMMQSWMGSDFSNDDMVKESSMIDDYNAKLLSQDDKSYTLELLPKEDAAVVWGKLIVNVEKHHLYANTIEYYDEDFVLQRVLEFSDVKKIEELYVAHKLVMKPKDEEKKLNVTTVTFDYIKLHPTFKPNLFTKRALKRYSR